MVPDAPHDAEAARVRRRDELLARRADELAALPPALLTMYPRRAGRSAAGITTLVVTFALAPLAHRQLGLLLATGGALLAALVYARARVQAALVQGEQLDWLIRRSLSADGDVRRLEEIGPLTVIRELAAPLDRRAAVWPLAGLALGLLMLVDAAGIVAGAEARALALAPLMPVGLGVVLCGLRPRGRVHPLGPPLGVLLGAAITVAASGPPLRPTLMLLAPALVVGIGFGWLAAAHLAWLIREERTLLAE